MTNIKEVLLNLLRKPLLNLVVNITMMIIDFVVAIFEVLHGNPTVAATLFLSAASCISGIFYWILVWHANKRQHSAP